MLRIATATRTPTAPVCRPDTANASRCRSCPARAFAVCAALDDEQLGVLDAADTRQNVPAGYPFFAEGDPTDYVYILVSGTVRMSKLLADGRRQVTGFLTAGDILGFEYRGEHSYSAEALSEADVCRFDAEEFELLRQRFQSLEHSLISRLSADLVQAQEQMLLLGRKTPLEKLASFLLRLRKRQRLTAGGQTVRLPMTRADIADYLGLTIETVSRSFTFLRKAGVVDLPEPSLVRIRDRERLEAIAA